MGWAGVVGGYWEGEGRELVDVGDLWGAACVCVITVCVCAPLCSMWGRSGFAQMLAAFLAYWADFVRIRWTEWRKEWWCRWINVHCFSKWVNVKPSPFERVLHWPCTPPQNPRHGSIWTGESKKQCRSWMGCRTFSRNKLPLSKHVL